MTNKLKVAAVGTGYFSQFHYDGWSRCPEVELVGVADLNLDAAQQVVSVSGGKAFADVAKMLDAVKPDLLDIITPPPTHLGMIELAAQRGINTVCQKPFCGDYETAKCATKVGLKAGIDITVHENFRFQPWYMAIRKELESGLLGEIYQATFRLRPGDGQGANAYLDRQPYFQEMERFLIHETGIHFIDVLRYLLGEPNSVWADLVQLNPAIAGEDKCFVVMKFGGNVRGVLDGNRLSDHDAENCRRTMCELMIEGEKGVLSLSGDGEVSFRRHGSQDTTSIKFDWNDTGFGGDCVYLFTRHVVDHYANGVGALMNSAQDYLANLEIEEAAYQSAADGAEKQLTSI